MNAELIAVGTELLLGQIANTDGEYLSKKLAELGIDVFYHTVVGDNPKRLKDAVKLAFSRADCVILSGGLGPTKDDLTKETVAEYFGLSMYEDKETLQRIIDRLNRGGRKMTENNKKQALIPDGAIIMQNDFGTAPGIIIERDNKISALLPGPPSEFKPMVDNTLIPYLQTKSDSVLESVVLRIFGIGESQLETQIQDLVCMSNPSVAPYAKEGEVTLRISAKAETKEKAQEMILPIKEKIKNLFGDMVYAEGDNNSLAEVVCTKLYESGKTIAVAESCTGGLVSARITDFPGSSNYFLEGCVTYSNQAKMHSLGVSEDTLYKFGAVSEQTAIEMARGVREKNNADIGVSTTGIAGPGGGTAQKPVGLVYVGFSTKDEEYVYKLTLVGHRNKVRNTTVLHVFNGLRKILFK